MADFFDLDALLAQLITALGLALVFGNGFAMYKNARGETPEGFEAQYRPGPSAVPASDWRAHQRLGPRQPVRLNMTHATIGAVRGCSSMAEHQLPKLNTGVRFPSPALSRPTRFPNDTRLDCNA